MDDVVVAVADYSEQVSALRRWFESVAAIPESSATFVLHDVHACPCGKPHEIACTVIESGKTSALGAAEGLVASAADYAIEHGPGEYTFEVFNSDDPKRLPMMRFTLEADFVDDEDFDDVVDETLTKRDLWLRFATAAISGTAAPVPDNFHGTIVENAQNIADQMVDAFCDRWPEDITDVPSPANDEPVVTLDEFEAKWGPGGAHLQKLVDAFVQRVPDFPSDHVFAKRLGVALSDLESALRDRKEQP